MECLQKAGCKSTIPSSFIKSLFKKQNEFQYKVKNREFILEYNPNKWENLLTISQRYFNDFRTRTMFLNIWIIFDIVLVIQCLYTNPRFGRQDYHNPKFEQKTYCDLEEGGDEGGDND